MRCCHREHVDQGLDLALERMGINHLEILPVVSRTDARKLADMVTLRDVLDSWVWAEWMGIEACPVVKRSAGERASRTVRLSFSHEKKTRQSVACTTGIYRPVIWCVTNLVTAKIFPNNAKKTK